MNHWSLDKPGSAEDPARSVVVDPVGPPRRSAEILFFPVRSAAAYADLEDATELDDSWESVGSVAVRLVGNFGLPRILVWGGGEGREDSPLHR